MYKIRLEMHLKMICDDYKPLNMNEIQERLCKILLKILL